MQSPTTKAIHFKIYLLKPCQNKKGQSFVVMHGFCMFFFNLHQLPAAKKTCKNRASQRTFGCSYFVRALYTNLQVLVEMTFKKSGGKEIRRTQKITEECNVLALSLVRFYYIFLSCLKEISCMYQTVYVKLFGFKLRRERIKK